MKTQKNEMKDWKNEETQKTENNKIYILLCNLISIGRAILHCTYKM